MPGSALKKSRGSDMSQEDIAWLAGLVEGEGSFFIHQARGDYYYPTFKIMMTDEDVIMEVQRVLRLHGIDCNVNKWQPPPIKRYIVGEGIQLRQDKTTWQLRTTVTDKVEAIINLLYPYFFSKKRADCDRLMELIKEKRNK